MALDFGLIKSLFPVSDALGEGMNPDFVQKVVLEDIGSGIPIIIPTFTVADWTVVQGTWANISSFMPWGNLIYNSSSADGDEITIKTIIPKGTYDVNIISYKSTDYGIVDFSIDGVVIGSVDNYNNSTISNVNQQFSNVVVSTDGNHIFKLKVNGKNGASTSYKVPTQAIIMMRLAI